MSVLIETRFDQQEAVSKNIHDTVQQQTVTVEEVNRKVTTTMAIHQTQTSVLANMNNQLEK